MNFYFLFYIVDYYKDLIINDVHHHKNIKSLIPSIILTLQHVFGITLKNKKIYNWCDDFNERLPFPDEQQYWGRCFVCGF